MNSFFVPAVLLSIVPPHFLPSSVSMSYFILAVPMRECLGKHSSMSSFPIAILNDTCFFREAKWYLLRPMLRISKVIIIVHQHIIYICSTSSYNLSGMCSLAW